MRFSGRREILSLMIAALRLADIREAHIDLVMSGCFVA
jgi:hypothetical protein